MLTLQLSRGRITNVKKTIRHGTTMNTVLKSRNACETSIPDEWRVFADPAGHPFYLVKI